MHEDVADVLNKEAAVSLCMVRQVLSSAFPPFQIPAFRYSCLYCELGLGIANLIQTKQQLYFTTTWTKHSRKQTAAV